MIENTGSHQSWLWNLSEIITHFNGMKNELPMILSGNSDVFINKLITIFYIIFNLLINLK